MPDHPLTVFVLAPEKARPAIDKAAGVKGRLEGQTLAYATKDDAHAHRLEDAIRKVAPQVVIIVAEDWSKPTTPGSARESKAPIL